MNCSQVVSRLSTVLPLIMKNLVKLREFDLARDFKSLSIGKPVLSLLKHDEKVISNRWISNFKRAEGVQKIKVKGSR